MISEISLGPNAIVECHGQIVRLFGGLIARNQRRDRDDAAVAW